MNSKRTVSKVLRRLALMALVAGVGTWIVTGAHVGWTRTRAVEMKRDEITGIDYPVQQPAFVAGIEFPVAGLAAALSLFGLSLIRRRPVAANA